MSVIKTNMFGKENRQKLRIIGAVVLIVLGVLVFLHLRHSSNNASDGAKETVGTNGETINFAPATEEERQQAEAHKQALIDQQNRENNNTSNSLKTVTPVISRAQQNGNAVEINAFVSGVSENNGVCTFNLQKGDLIVTKTTAGFQDATTTVCTPLSISKSELELGKWTASISYLSNTAQGKSEAVVFSVE